MEPNAGAHEGGSSPEVLRRLRRGATRALFATSLLFAPMPFSMLFIVGLVPLSCTVAFFLSRITVTSGGDGSREMLVVPAILAAHLIVDGGLLYLVWAIICRLIFRFLPGRAAMSAVVLLISGQVIASFLPVYVLAGEHDTNVMSLWHVWQELVVGGR